MAPHGIAAPPDAGAESPQNPGRPDIADERRRQRRLAEFDATIALWRDRADAARQALTESENARRRYLEGLPRSAY